MFISFHTKGLLKFWCRFHHSCRLISALPISDKKISALDMRQPSQRDCDSSYPDVCIASPPPDLNCVDISGTNFKVLPPDPHGFDRDGDGKGCET
jgi:hypothetical protein